MAVRHFRFKHLIICLCVLTAGCNPTKFVPDNEYLLVKNEIHADSSVLPKERFESLLKQEPNRKILGLFRFHLGLYNMGRSGSPEKLPNLKSWLRRIGEEPVILDSVQIGRTEDQFRIYLSQNGFFNAGISDSVSMNRKKAVVSYHIEYGRAYTIRKVSYDTQDTGIVKYLAYYQQQSLLLPGDRYDEAVMDNERERITSHLRDRGYYFFNKNYITFSVDTTLGSHQADIFLYINRINENVDPSLINNAGILNHQSYRLGEIYIQPDFNPKNPMFAVPADTTRYEDCNIISVHPKRIITDPTLLRTIFIKKGDRYYQRNIDYTYKRIQDLNIFKFINIVFKEVPRDENQKEYLLEVNIQLTPMDEQDFTAETEATNTGGNFGIAGSFGYRNKNIFRGAEVFELRLKGGLEAIENFNDSTETRRLLFFNTYEIGPEMSFTFKKFLLPKFLTKGTSRYFNPRTQLTASFNFQERPDYTRSITNFTFGYVWNSSRTQRWIVNPFEVNSVKVDLSPEFRAKLESLNDPRLRYSYENHLIPSGKVTWIFSNQETTKKNHFLFLRGTFETSGLILASLAPSLDLKENDDGTKLIAGVPFSQFVKFDFDVSTHRKINNWSTMVYRLAAGVGLPSGNSRALPFEKSFFGGGANSVRAWRARTLGPGSYAQPLFIEQSGDMKIEANVEYRSQLLRIFESAIMEGAAFVDAGNIWMRNEDISRPGGQFEFGNALSELGVGGGLGLRFNFSFFLLRLDFAVKLRDPSLPLLERWVYPEQKFVIGDVNVNLAIGYPF